MTSAKTAGFIERAYKVRLRLTRLQQHQLARLFGATRYVWNWALAMRTTAYKDRGEKLNWIALSKLFTAYRVAHDTAWLSTLPREPFNQVLRDQEEAFTNFFSKRAKYPRFKRRGQGQSVRFTLDQRRTQVDRAAGTVVLPGLGTVRFKQTYGEMPGRLRSVTLTLDAAGRYYASFTADQVPAPDQVSAAVQSIGIDLGLSHWATLSNGAALAVPKPLSKHLQRLRRYQRSTSRKRDVALRSIGLDPSKPIPKGMRLPVSNRTRRMQRRVGKLHARIKDIRSNALHQFTTGIVHTHNIVCIEDLAVKALARGMGRRAFRRSVADAALGELRRQLEYKAGWFKRTVVKVGRFYPSSKTCSSCGVVKQDLKLNERNWVCRQCATAHDRDLNAARNIEAEGLRLLAETTPRSGGCNARGAAKGRMAEIVPLFQPSVMNREPVKSRQLTASTQSSRWERRRLGT